MLVSLKEQRKKLSVTLGGVRISGNLGGVRYISFANKN